MNDKFYDIIEDLGLVIQNLAEIGKEGADIKCKSLTVKGGNNQIGGTIEADDITLEDGVLDCDEVTVNSSLKSEQKIDDPLKGVIGLVDDYLKELAPGVRQSD